MFLNRNYYLNSDTKHKVYLSNRTKMGYIFLVVLEMRESFQNTSNGSEKH